ncbi:hypothetical protein [Novipirellula artificiosorum]|uniref:Uncharacterized protein n=1 Tax=Novipirellula artificiosorum TaxID=2528016 RepID=A0A5C6DZ58_9BACT|nr:hypothetical protein [Novipirellula artificiosorum]TWU40701.1 hypothetical protein Poly41_15360 [Novipirellula artificiosorum]
MARHERLCRPFSPNVLVFRTVLFCCALFFGIAGATWVTCDAAETAVQPGLDLTLELHWLAASPQRWRVHVEAVDPQQPAILSSLENRCEDPRSCGSFRTPTAANEWFFEPREPSNSGAARFRVQASDNAELVVQVNALDETPSPGSVAVSQPQGTRISLRQLALQEHHNSDGPAWTLQRVASDAFRIEASTSSPIVEADSPITMSVRAHRLDLPALGLSPDAPPNLVSSLVRLSDRHVMASHTVPFPIDSSGNSPSVAVSHRTPIEPGVYEIRCEIVHADRLWTRLRRREDAILRTGKAIVVLPAKISTGGRVDFSVWPTLQTIHLSDASQWSVPQFFSYRSNPLIPTPRMPSRVASEAPRFREITLGDKQISLISPNGTFETPLPKLRVGSPHHITVRYPANRPINIGLRLGRSQPANADTARPLHSLADFVIQDQRRAEDRHSVDPEGWRQQSVLYYPQGQDQLQIINLDPARDAAIESIEIKGGPTDLVAPVEAVDPSDSRCSAIAMDDFRWVDKLSMDQVDRYANSEFTEESITLHRLYVATMRLNEYAAVLGANAVLIPANQAGRSWFHSSLFLPAKRSCDIEPECLDVLMSLMDRCDRNVMIAIDPVMTMSDLERTDLGDPRPEGYHFVDRRVRVSLAKLISEVVAEAKLHPCFGGIALSCGASGYARPIDTTTFPCEAVGRQFAAETGSPIAVPVDLANWMNQPVYAKFQQWANQSSRLFYETLASQCEGHALLLVDLPQSAFANDAASGLVGPSWPAASRDPPIIPVVSQQYGPNRSLSLQVDAQSRAGQDRISLEPHAGRIGLAILPDPSDAPTAVSVIGRSQVAALQQSIDRLDPAVILLNGHLLAGSLPLGLRQTLAGFRALPRTPLQELVSADPCSETVHVKWGVDKQKLSLLIANVAPWPNDVELACRTPIHWIMEGKEPASLIQNPDRTRTKIELGAGEMVVLYSDSIQSPDALFAWSSHVRGGDAAIDRIKMDVTTVVEKLGTLSDSDPYPALSNGSFEVSSDVGITGWLHAQYPEGCVTIDTAESIEGKKSVCLITDGHATMQTWLVSETITPPASGRLAVSLACRAKSAEVSSPHRVRVSVEGTQAGTPFRYSQEVEVPRNGQWQPRKILAEADQIQPTSTESLRITIDSLSPGQLWIDDVRLHDRFPTGKERTELQNQAFLAVQGLQRGNLEPCSRLLKNRWSQVLLDASSTHTKSTNEQSKSKESEAPGVAERIRSWLPSPMRF